MRVPEPIFLTAASGYLPTERLRTHVATEQGHLTPEELAESQYRSLAVEPTLWPADMAAIASRGALRLSGLDPQDIQLILATRVHRHGHRSFWSMGPYIQHILGVRQAMATTLHGGCSMQLASAELVVPYLLAQPERAVVVASADRLSGSTANRWRVDYGICFGDGGAAGIFSRRPGLARLLSTRTLTFSGLETLHRMSAPHEQTEQTLVEEWDVRSCKKTFLQEHGRGALAEATGPQVAGLFAAALDDAGVKREQIRRFVLPFLGHKLLHDSYLKLCDGDTEQTAYAFGAGIGHIGPADQLLGLIHLVHQGALVPGDHVAMLSAGAGFTVSVMIVQIQDPSLATMEGPDHDLH